MQILDFLFSANSFGRDDSVVWTLNDNGELANQIARLVAIVVKSCVDVHVSVYKIIQLQQKDILTNYRAILKSQNVWRISTVSHSCALVNYRAIEYREQII